MAENIEFYGHVKNLEPETTGERLVLKVHSKEDPAAHIRLEISDHSKTEIAKLHTIKHGFKALLRFEVGELESEDEK